MVLKTFARCLRQQKTEQSDCKERTETTVRNFDFISVLTLLIANPLPVLNNLFLASHFLLLSSGRQFPYSITFHLLSVQSSSSHIIPLNLWAAEARRLGTRKNPNLCNDSSLGHLPNALSYEVRNKKSHLPQKLLMYSLLPFFSMNFGFILLNELNSNPRKERMVERSLRTPQ